MQEKVAFKNVIYFSSDIMSQGIIVLYKVGKYPNILNLILNTYSLYLVQVNFTVVKW